MNWLVFGNIWCIFNVTRLYYYNNFYHYYYINYLYYYFIIIIIIVVVVIIIIIIVIIIIIIIIIITTVFPIFPSTDPTPNNPWDNLLVLPTIHQTFTSQEPLSTAWCLECQMIKMELPMLFYHILKWHWKTSIGLNPQIPYQKDSH